MKKKIRRRSLPPGWYPDSERAVRNMLEKWQEELALESLNAIAGIVPHAGWEFSGKLAFSVFRALRKDADSVIVVGGHLPTGGGIFAAPEGGYETPLGLIDADLELLDFLRKNISLREDIYSDNTVETQLPFIKYSFPSTKALALRASPSEEAIELGELLHRASEELNKKMVVIGSTDLTHYGISFGFTPKGYGKEAEKWVKEVNDRRIIDALLMFRLEEAIRLGVKEKAACSAGGAVAAANYAKLKGAGEGQLLGYYTSLEIHPAESFVGYAGIAYE